MFKKISFLGVLTIIVLMMACSDSGDTGGLGGTGTAGSLARFIIVEDHLYVVTKSTLHTFNISDPNNTVKIPMEEYINEGVETIFHYSGNLFLGHRNGVDIYNISDNPSKPTYVSDYWHFTSCDPVVVSGSYAYITLRNDGDCQRGQNVLDIVNIDSLEQPTRVNSIPLLNPHGLGLNDSLLFVTEGDFGVKVFDRSQPDTLVLISHIDHINATDVIVNDHILIITGENGVYQYDFTNPKKLKLLSRL